MVEINLMRRYPKTKRDLEKRIEEKTEDDRLTAKKFGEEFFDGDRRHGYGGYNYNPRFFSGVVEDMMNHYKLDGQSKILDIGCAKGFLLYDFTRIIPGVKVRGVDISEYAIKNGKEEVRSFLSVGNANNLNEFKDKEYDLVVSITTIHNLPLDECKHALSEIGRIGKHSFITVDAWRNEEEKKKMLVWNLTGETIMHVFNWKKLFEEVGYTGDYYWFTP